MKKLFFTNAKYNKLGKAFSKRPTEKKLARQITIIAVLFTVFTVTSCKENVLTDDTTKTKTQLQEGENYSLVGTNWRLVGFVENDQLRKPEAGENNFLPLSFISDIKMTGLLGVNSFQIPYSVDGNKIFTYEIYQGLGAGYTKLCCDPADGELYWEILFHKVKSFQLIRVDDLQQLKLFYDDGKSYLLFNRMEGCYDYF